MIVNLRYKINGAILITFIIIAIIFSGIQLPFQKRRLQDVIRKNEIILHTLVKRDKVSIANEIFEGHDRALKIRLKQMLEVEGIQAISVFDEQGKLIIYDGFHPVKNDLSKADQELAAVDTKIHRKMWQGKHVLSYLMEIQVIGERIGFIEVHYSLGDFEEEKRLTILIFGSLLGSIFLIMLVLLNLILSKTIIFPITFLRDAMQQMRAGQLGKQVHIKNKDEIGDLSRVFNLMSNELAESYRQIEEQNIELEHRVEERTSELSSLLENSPDYIFNVDRHFTIQYLNRPIENLSVDEVVGKSAFMLLNKENHERIKEAIVEVFEVGKCEMIDIRNIMPNGNDYWLEIRFASIKAGNQINEVMVIVSDITERIKAQEQLKAAQKELIEKAHRAGMFDIASSNLHNIGNLLNSIVTSTHLIKEITQKPNMEKLKKANEILSHTLDTAETPITNNPQCQSLLKYYLYLEETLSREIKEISNEIERLGKMAQSIDYVIKSQQAYVSFGTITDEHDLVEIINDVIKIHAKQLDQNNIKVVVNTNDTYKVQAQRVKMVHILTNLIKNAVDSMQHTPINSRILRFWIQPEKNYIILKVSDQGIGIEKENITKIFYFGFNSKDNEFDDGLHSSANYMTEMGGKIWAESEGKNKGATFILKFKSIA